MRKQHNYLAFITSVASKTRKFRVKLWDSINSWPLFRGAGYAHGEWSSRVARAGLINHPQRWVDIKEGRDRFVQVGDTEGGRWNEDEEVIKRQLSRNRGVLKELQLNEYTFHKLVLE
jgi:hypothetical protein